MTVCSECGAPLDPTVIHVQHFGCSSDDWDDCDCPEVCASCCQDSGCPLREPQETNVTDPLSDFQVAEMRSVIEKNIKAGKSPMFVAPSDLLRLVATVEQVRKERDEARQALIERRLEVDAIRQARAVIQDAAWQFNEAVSLLREAREHVAPATSLLADIDDGLPAIQEALVAMFDAIRQAQTGPEVDSHE